MAFEGGDIYTHLFRCNHFLGNCAYWLSNVREHPADPRIPDRFPGNPEYFHSFKKQNTESPLGPAVSLEFVIIALVITPLITIFTLGWGPSSWLLILVFITGSLASELLFPAPAASKKKER